MKVSIDTGYTQKTLEEEPEYSGQSRIEILSDEGSVVCSAVYDLGIEDDRAEFERTVAELYRILETASSPDDAVSRAAALPRMQQTVAAK
jgi:hypothetical protein